MITSPLAPVPPDGPGPEQQVVGTLTEALVARGHEVVLYASGDSTTSGELRSLRSRALTRSLDELRERLGVTDHVQKGLLALTRLIVDQHLSWAVRDAASAGFDAIHCHAPLAAFQPGLETPRVLTVHGGFPCGPGWVRSFLATGLAELDPDRAVELVCISRSQRASWPSDARARVVHHGIDPSDFPLGDGERKWLLHIGRIAFEKGTHLAIEVARRTGLPLVIAGPIAGPLAVPEYFERHIRPQLGGAIEYVGEVDHAGRLELYRGAIALVAPLQWDEPFGLTLVESMACGTPVLALRRGSAPELVADGVSGFVTEDIAQLGDRVVDAAALDAAAVRAHVAEHFSVDRMVQGYEAAYRDAVSRR